MGGPSRCARRWAGTGAWPTSRPAAGPRSTRPWRPRAPPSPRGRRSARRAGTRSCRASRRRSPRRCPSSRPSRRSTTGRCWRRCALRVLPRGASNVRFFADFAVERLAEAPRTLPGGERNAVRHDPAGVVAVSTPWNAPFMLATWRVGPALAAGNTVVLKPPEWAPLTCSMLGDLALEAGLPPGVLNVVHGTGAEAGAPLDRPPRRRPRRLHRLAGDRAHRVPRRRRPADARLLRARGQVALRRPRRRRPRRRRGHRRLPVRQLRPGLPRRHPAARPALGARRLPGALPRARRRHPRRRPARAGHDVRPAHPPGRARARDHARRAARSRRAPRSPSGASRSAACTTRRRSSPTSPPAPSSCARRSSAPSWRCSPSTTTTEAVRLANATDFGLAATIYTGSPDRAPTSSARGSARARCGSTASTSATSRRRSAGRRTRASAARAATTRSTSTATSRPSASARRSTGRAADHGRLDPPRARPHGRRRRGRGPLRATAGADRRARRRRPARAAALRLRGLLPRPRARRTTPRPASSSSPTSCAAGTTLAQAAERLAAHGVDAHEVDVPVRGRGLRLQDPAGNGVALLERRASPRTAPRRSSAAPTRCPRSTRAASST